MLDKATLVKINNFINNMPPLPISVSKILEITKNSNVDATELNNVITLDPVLSGKVLKLINSAYYSLPNHVTSIVRAIVMLGINTVKNLVLSSAILSNINNKNNFKALDASSFWRHSICTGVIAKYFAIKENINIKFIEEFFLAGLLHDIGKIPFNTVIPEEYVRCITYSRQNKISLHVAESHFFKINHCELGYRIAELWKLNKDIALTILYHHNINEIQEQEYKKFIATVSLANIVTNKAEIGFSGNKYNENKEEEIFKITGLNWDIIDSAELTAEESIKKAEIFLQIQS